MTRQYIGARYVPKFYTNSVDGSATWESNVVYQPLTYVTLTNGHMYISKKQVPATVGTPASNAEYWLDIGSYNGFIEELQDEIDAINEDVTELQQRSATKRHIVIIGNSYVTLGCADKVADYYDEHSIYTLGGSGFVGYVRETRTYEYCIDQAIADTNLDNDEVTDILFVCAVGETRAYTEKGEVNFVSELGTNLSAIMTKIKANFTNCHNVMVTYAETRKTAVITTPSADSYQALFAMHQLFRQHLPIYGYSYLGWSGFNTLYVNNWVGSDNYHPTDAGAQIIGQIILQSLFGDVIYRPIRERKQLTFNYGQSGTMYVNTEIYPDHVNINTETGFFSANSDVTIVSGGELLNLEDLNYPIPMIRSSRSIYSALVQTTTGVRYDIFNLVFSRSTDGIMKLLVNNNPSQATSGNVPLFIEALQSFDYYF